MTDIRSMTVTELKKQLSDWGEPAYRAAQLYGWMHRHHVPSVDDMTNIPKSLRAGIADAGYTSIRMVDVQESSDGTRKYLFELADGALVESVLMRYRYGNTVCISSQVGCRMGCRFCASTLGGLERNLLPSEMLDQIYKISDDIARIATTHPGGEEKEYIATIHPGGEEKEYIATTHPGGEEKEYIATTHPGGEEKEYIATTHPGGEEKEYIATTHPGEEEKERIATTHPGEEEKERIATTHPEEVEKERIATTHPGKKDAAASSHRTHPADASAPTRNLRVSHVVVMGTGEPFDNYDNLIRFLELITSPEGYNLSRRNITVSTCGIIPRIRELADADMGITLAISLHAPTDELRRTMMPIANRYSVEEIVEAAAYYFEKTGRRVTFEYALARDVNDTDACAEELARLCRRAKAHVNLIPVNPVTEREYVPTGMTRVGAFKNKLEKQGINVTIRRELGQDIDGACGQLRKRHLGE